MKSFLLYKKQLAANNSLRLLLVVFLCAIVGCAREAKILVNTWSRLPAPIVERLESAGKIKTFRAFGSIELLVNGKKKGLDAVIVLKPPDRLRIDLMDQLAGPVASIISTPERLAYNDSSGSYVYEGEKRGEVFRKVLRVAWLPEDVIRVLVGNPPVDASFTSEYGRDSEGRYWLKEGTSAVKWQDSPDARLSYLHLKGGKVATKVEYSGYGKRGKILYPSQINIDVACPKTSVKLEYKDIDINVELPPDVFDAR